MSLFGDLPQAKGSTEASTASTSAPWAAPPMRPMQASKPKAPTATQFAPRAASGRHSSNTVSGGRTGSAPGRGGGRSGQQPQEATQALHSSLHNSSFLSPAGQPIRDEYDPLRPNEYEELLRMRERRKKEAEAEAERHRQIKEMEEIAAAKAQEAKALQEAGAVASHREEMLDLSGAEAFLHRARLSGRNPEPQPSEPHVPTLVDEKGPTRAERKGMTLAQKMLLKMGWREGEGLGKDGQGMTTPLMAQKTDKNAGVIVNAPATEEDTKKRAATDPQELVDGAKKLKTEQMKTKVIVMRNMVGPGEVDEELEDEVGNELTKYGEVSSVMIFEVTTPGYEPEETVRIFVEFEEVDSASKALEDLQGRFFGGRSVRVAFFDEGRFERLELGPQAGEFS